jgi:hypothetical protein
LIFQAQPWQHASQLLSTKIQHMQPSGLGDDLGTWEPGWKNGDFSMGISLGLIDL